MSPAAPTPAEMMRRLDEIVTEVRDLRQSIETGYVRKDVLAEVRRMDDEVHANLREDVTSAHTRVTDLKREQVASRRLAVTAVIAPLAVAVLSAIIIFALFGPST